MRRAAPFLGLVVASVFLAGWFSFVEGQPTTPTITIFEGARLITGNGSRPIENSAFIVENGRFTRVGRRGDVPLRARDEVIPNAALFRTAGPGLAWPGSGAQGDPSRMDVSYPVSTVADARAAVQDYVLMKPAFVKIWVDDRGGTKKTLTPDLHRAVIDEAHKSNVPVGVHNVTLANAKELMRAGVEGWLHVPARGGEVADDELVAIVKERIARKNRPNIWMTPSFVVMGLTPSQAIVAATRDSADVVGFNTGLVAPGRNGDFIVLDANPLESISNTRRINKVYLHGQEVPRAAMAAKWTATFRG